MDEKQKEEVAKGEMPPAFLKDKKDDKSDKDDDKEKADKEKMDKSMVSEAEFAKSLDGLEQLIKGSPTQRKQDLFAKSLAGSATPEEIAELTSMIQGKSSGLAETVSKSLGIEGNETFAKSLDVSDYLKTLHKSIETSLTSCAQAIEKSTSSRSDETVVLAKALLDVAKLSAHNARQLSQLTAKMGTVAAQPARGPRAAQTSEQLAAQAAAAGVKPQPGQLSKAEVLETLGEMCQKSFAEGRDGLSKSNEMLDIACSQFEQFNEISPALLREVTEFRRNGRAS